MVTILLVIAHSARALAYSVLTHEAIIDAVWNPSIKPLLLKRFPSASADELRQAHAYTYGGCIIQDMGYYPFGSKFFSDLVHYMRSGEFIVTLIDESQDLNEYAFALGALAHYAADNNGHPIATNRAVPILYPKLCQQFGPEVTYADNPKAHLQVEFSFDVVQVARGRYLPDAYHDFIGFEVSKPVLERAFRKIYGLELKDIFTSVDLALGTYRRTVSTILPKMTKVAWQAKRDEIANLTPGVTRERFIYKLPRVHYEKEWGKNYKKPRWSDKVLAFLFQMLPKIGPLRALSFRPLTPATEQMFIESFNATVTAYTALLTQTKEGRLILPNKDFDTGRPTHAGEYILADQVYARLLDKLVNDHPERITPDLRADILAFYSSLNAPIATKKKKDTWQKTLANLEKLKNASPPAVKTTSP